MQSVSSTEENYAFQSRRNRLGIDRAPLRTSRSGHGLEAIAAYMGVGVGTVLRHAGEGSEIQEKVFGT